MRLTLLFDHRFYRDPDGVIFSSSNYNYALYADRYLQVFDDVTIVARVSAEPPANRDGRRVEGPGVTLVDTGTWGSLRTTATHLPRIAQVLVRQIGRDSAVIGIGPGRLAMAGVSARRQPYGLEVVGDSAESLAPDAFAHPLAGRFEQIWPALTTRAIRRAAAVAYVSEGVLQAKYPPGPGAFTTHYSSIDLPDDTIVNHPKKPPVDRRAELVLVGSLNGLHKGPDTLIDAVAACVRDGLDLGLTIIGTGHSEASLRRRAAPLGDRVTFTGQLPAGEAMREFLDSSDLFILPTLTEGLPRSVIEAMARGLPAITTPVGGCVELLPAEDMTPVGDVEALRQKIHEVVTSPERMQRMAARNLARSRDYRNSVLSERRLAFYREVRDRTLAAH